MKHCRVTHIDPPPDFLPQPVSRSDHAVVQYTLAVLEGLGVVFRNTATYSHSSDAQLVAESATSTAGDSSELGRDIVHYLILS